jgi:hypothetical protein
MVCGAFVPSRGPAQRVDQILHTKPRMVHPRTHHHGYDGRNKAAWGRGWAGSYVGRATSGYLRRRTESARRRRKQATPAISKTTPGSAAGRPPIEQPAARNGPVE